MKENLLIDKSIAFASRIVRLQLYLIKYKKETVMSKQIIRSGTSIGVNINKANYEQSRLGLEKGNKFHFEYKNPKNFCPRALAENCIY